MPLFRSQLTSLARCIRCERHKRKDTQPGSPIGPFSYLEHSGDPDARKVLTAYKSVQASHRRLLPLEAFCLAAAVPPSRVLELVAAAVVKEGARITAVRAAVAQARVLCKTVERALHNEGWRERLTVHKAMGLVPTWAGRILRTRAPTNSGGHINAPFYARCQSCRYTCDLAGGGGECRLVREHRAPGRQGVRRCPDLRHSRHP